MPDPEPVQLLVHVPEAGRYVREGQKFPVYLFVDPSDADLEVSIHCHSSGTPSFDVTDGPFGPFNKLIEIDNLPAGKTHTLCVQAASDDQVAFHRCKVRRNIAQAPAKGSKKQALKAGKQVSKLAVPMGTDDPPDIVYPPNNATVAHAFPTYGYVDPATATLTAWVVNNATKATFAGTAVVPPPAPYDWAFSFMNIPSGTYTLTVQITPNGPSSSKTITVP